MPTVLSFTNTADHRRMMRATLLSRPTARTEFNTAAWICLSIPEILLAFSQMHVPLERADWRDSVTGYKLQRGVLLLTHGVLTRCIIVIRRLLANANTVFSSRVHLSRQSNFCIKKCHATFNWSCELEYHACSGPLYVKFRCNMFILERMENCKVNHLRHGVYSCSFSVCQPVSVYVYFIVYWVFF